MANTELTELEMIDSAAARHKLMKNVRSGLAKGMVETQQQHNKTVPTVRRRLIGIKSRLSMMEYVCSLLDLNEDRNELPHPLNDQALKAAIVKEFARYENTVRSFLDGTNNLSKLRYDFNHAKMLETSWPSDKPGHPPRLSLRYNDDGTVAKPGSRSRKRQVATNEELRLYLARFPHIQESFEDLMVRLGRKSKGGIYLPSATE